MEPQRHRVTEYNKDYKFKEKKLTGEIIAAAMEVHRNLGPGLLESAYEECLCHELHLKDIPFERQKPLPLVYKEIKLDCGYRMDLVVDNKVIIEIKCVEEINPVHKAQLLTYLKLYDKQVGLIINFYKPLLKNGIKRLVL
ncbi:GxxExxY protein [bacterium]|nr:GxxExxY protein [bacterium]